MKTEEDEAFDELAKRQGSWGGGFKAKQAMAADKLWDKPSVAFDEWWNGDNDESTNPFRLESGAYWAWAGWKAALAQPAQEPDALTIAYQFGFYDGKKAALAQPAQEPVAWMTPDGEGFRIRFAPPVNDVPLGWDALYTTPPQRPWVGLTDEELKKIWYDIKHLIGWYSFQESARATEAKLKERNS